MTPVDPILDRRQWFGRAGTFAAAFSIAPAAVHRLLAATRPGPISFEAIARSVADEVAVPKGYKQQVFVPWGTWLDGRKAAFDIDATSADQQKQTGMYHDGMSFFPIDARWSDAELRLVGSSTHGFLVINHESTDEGLLHRDGTADWVGKPGVDKVRKSKAAVGVSIVVAQKSEGEWRVIGGRRVSGLDEIEIRGPARGHSLMRTPGERSTKAEKAGTGVDGTMSNCANGQTPWGTYLTCEENFQDYFARTPNQGGGLEPRMERYGIGEFSGDITGGRSIYGWEAHDPRFDADRPEYRQHCHRFGWVVEIDPRDPERKSAKRTALGRFRHENAAVVLAPDGRVVVYMGDDSRFEYVYKFVSDARFLPELEIDNIAERRRKKDHNWGLLDEGRLFVARFEAKGIGVWEELDHRRAELRGEFQSQAEVVIFARRAADLVKATKMDRPEWVVVDQEPESKKVRFAYVSLTNNNERGVPDLEGPNPANPRVDNVYGHIVRWRDAGGDPTAKTFEWNTFVTCGYRRHPVAAQRGNIKDAPDTSDQDYGSPDSMWFDPRGILWVQTDVSLSLQDDRDNKEFGNNQMLAVDAKTGETRRFLVGPKGCEVTGMTMTPDYRTMFVNIQHPGEAAEGFSDPKSPLAGGGWPNGARDRRPRSATVIITHEHGKPIGAGTD